MFIKKESFCVCVCVCVCVPLGRLGHRLVGLSQSFCILQCAANLHARFEELNRQTCTETQTELLK